MDNQSTNVSEKHPSVSADSVKVLVLEILALALTVFL